MRQALYSIIILLVTCSYTLTSSSSNKVDKQDLIGKWKFTYIEAFDWSKHGIQSDSLEVDLYWTVSKDQIIEEMKSDDGDMIRIAEWKYRPLAKKISGKYISQKTNEVNQDEETKGFVFNTKITRLENNQLEIYHKYPKSHKEEFALPGYGKCILKRVE